MSFYVAYYVLLIVLAVLGIVCAVYGFAISIKNGFVGFGQALSDARYSQKPSWLKFLPDFIYKWFVLIWRTFVETWKGNIVSIQNSFSNSSCYKFLSFTKWVYILGALSIMIFGAIGTVAFLMLNWTIFLILVQVVLFVFIALNAVIAIAGLGYSLYFTAPAIIRAYSENMSYYGDFVGYIVNDAYRNALAVFFGMWSSCVENSRDVIWDFNQRGFVSFKKWMCLWAAIFMYIVTALVSVACLVVHSIVLLPIYLVCLVIKLIRRY